MTDPRAAVFDTARYKRGRVEGDRLTRALVEAASKGQKPNCSQPETHSYWTSEHEGETALAAIWCTGCPVLSLAAKRLRPGKNGSESGRRSTGHATQTGRRLVVDNDRYPDTPQPQPTCTRSTLLATWVRFRADGRGATGSRHRLSWLLQW